MRTPGEQAAVGDEDWEAEISNSHMSSYVPVFEKDTYSSGANADTFTRTHFIIRNG